MTRVALLLLLTSPLDAAAARPQTVGSAPSLVIITTSQRAEALELFASTVRAHLSDRGVETRLVVLPDAPENAPLTLDGIDPARYATDPSVLVVLWLDVSTRDALRLYLYDARRQRAFERTVRTGDEPVASYFETLAIMVRAAVATVRSEAVRTISDDDTSWRPVSLVDEPDDSPRWGIETAYVGQLEAQSADGLQHGAAVRITGALAANISWFAGVRLMPRQRYETELILLEIQRTPALVGLRWASATSGHRWGLEVAGVADFRAQSSESRADGVEPAGRQRRTFFSVAADLLAIISVSRHWALVVRGGAEYWPVAVRYVAEGELGQRVVSDPWTVQPMVQVGFRAEFR